MAWWWWLLIWMTCYGCIVKDYDIILAVLLHLDLVDWCVIVIIVCQGQRWQRLESAETSTTWNPVQSNTSDNTKCTAGCRLPHPLASRYNTILWCLNFSTAAAFWIEDFLFVKLDNRQKVETVYEWRQTAFILLPSAHAHDNNSERKLMKLSCWFNKAVWPD